MGGSNTFFFLLWFPPLGWVGKASTRKLFSFCFGTFSFTVNEKVYVNLIVAWFLKCFCIYFLWTGPIFWKRGRFQPKTREEWGKETEWKHSFCQESGFPVSRTYGSWCCSWRRVHIWWVVVWMIVPCMGIHPDPPSSQPSDRSESPKKKKKKCLLVVLLFGYLTGNLDCLRTSGLRFVVGFE